MDLPSFSVNVQKLKIINSTLGPEQVKQKMRSGKLSIYSDDPKKDHRRNGVDILLSSLTIN